MQILPAWKRRIYAHLFNLQEYAKVMEEGGRLPTYRDIAMDEVNMLKWTALMVPVCIP
jgi:hypothetical protein